MKKILLVSVIFILLTGCQVGQSLGTVEEPSFQEENFAYNTGTYFDSDDFEELLSSFGWWNIYQTEEGEIYLYNYVTGYRIEAAWYYDEDGELVEVDLIEHAANLNYYNRINAEFIYMQ